MPPAKPRTSGCLTVLMPKLPCKRKTNVSVGINSQRWRWVSQ